MHRYIALIRPTMEGPCTDTLYDVDMEKKERLQNKFLPEDKQKKVTPPPRTLTLKMRAQLNNMEIVAFESEVPFTFESLDDFLRAYTPEELNDFFKKYKAKI